MAGQGRLVDDVIATAVAGFVHHDVVADQLTVVLVGRQHEGLHARFAGFRGERSDDVVGLEAVYLEDGDVHRLENIFYNRYARANVLRSLLALCLIGREGFRAEGRSVRIEGHGQVAWLLLLHHLVQRVAETEDGRCVEPFRVDTRVLDEGIIGTINQCVGI